MHHNRETTLRKFERTLRASIARKLGRKVSAQRFADQYNLRAYGTGTISRETARKWIRGTTIPDYERLSVLVQWLDLDPLEFLDHDNPKEKRISLDLAQLSAQGASNRLENLVTIVKALDERYAEALFVTAWALKQAGRVNTLEPTHTNESFNTKNSPDK
jgi:transcriptional regulator with XRE-family HTH domain